MLIFNFSVVHKTGKQGSNVPEDEHVKQLETVSYQGYARGQTNKWIRNAISEKRKRDRDKECNTGNETSKE